MCKNTFGPHIEQEKKEVSMCMGCHSCEMMCSLFHDGKTGPGYGRLQIELDSVSTMGYTVYTCQHCADHPCYDACPMKDKAMCIDEKGIVYINEENCIGCGKCVKACKFTPSRIVLLPIKDRKQRKARKCDLCRGREEGPACVAHCPAMVLKVSDPVVEEGCEV